MTGRTALVLGATGGIGGEAALALLDDGWQVRALHRDPGHGALKRAGLERLQWIAGDAMRSGDVIAAAEGVSVIFHGVNPPGYRNWRQLALPMLDSSIAAARAASARLIFPGTLYNFGPDAFPLVSELSPQNPISRKGRIRVEMERRLQAASADGVPALIVRAGDFFGSRVGNSWFTQGMIKPGKPVRSIVYPGKPDVGHAWAYVPDLAAAIVQLLARQSRLASFEVFHFGGYWCEPGINFAHAIQHVAGEANSKIRPFPWALAYAASPFVTVLREMLELRYIWQQPVRLDNKKLITFLGSEPNTPMEKAITVTLQALGCLKTPASPVA